MMQAILEKTEKWKFLGYTIGFLILANAIGYLFRAVHFPETNIVLIYILAVLMTARYTRGFYWGILASVGATLTFNYFFTEPYYTLSVSNPSYFITFAVMTIVAFFTSTLTSREKMHAAEARKREAEVKALYTLTNFLVDAQNQERIAQIAVIEISHLLECPVGCIYIEEAGKFPDTFLQYRKEGVVREEILNPQSLYKQIEQLKEEYVEDERFRNWPIRGREQLLGVLRIPKGTILEPQKKLVQSMLENISIAMDRMNSFEEGYRNRELIEQERYKANLLRSISHDLRTPLTGIMGTAEMIMDTSLEQDPRRKMAQEIYQDADWLHALVENILGLTRIQDGKRGVKRSVEALEEIVASAVEKIEKRAPGYDIIVEIPDEYIEVMADARLMEQVIVNLLDNAVKHTPESKEIKVSIKKQEDHMAKVMVTDSGEGISQEDLPYIFQMFYTDGKNRADARQGIGLGLAICEAVIKAHGGTIDGKNRSDRKGAVFSFTVPMYEEEKKDV